MLLLLLDGVDAEFLLGKRDGDGSGVTSRGKRNLFNPTSYLPPPHVVVEFPRFKRLWGNPLPVIGHTSAGLSLQVCSPLFVAVAPDGRAFRYGGGRDCGGASQ